MANIGPGGYSYQMVSNSVRKVIVDAKVGPPLYETGLAEEIIAAVSFSFTFISAFKLVLV